MPNWLSKIWAEIARPFFLRPQRVQCAALCTRVINDQTQVLLITSRDTRRWIIPKGWPIDGLDGAESARQEAWEEAGVRARRLGSEAIGQYTYDKTMNDGTALPVVTSVYLIEVAELADEYPEIGQRERQWFSPQDAAEKVIEPELSDLLRRM